MSANTIANRLRSILAELEQLDTDLSETNDADLMFDVGTRLNETRTTLRVAHRIAEGAADAEDAAHSRQVEETGVWMEKRWARRIA
jgi:hypothetical protein